MDFHCVLSPNLVEEDEVLHDEKSAGGSPVQVSNLAEEDEVFHDEKSARESPLQVSGQSARTYQSVAYLYVPIYFLRVKRQNSSCLLIFLRPGLPSIAKWVHVLALTFLLLQ